MPPIPANIQEYLEAIVDAKAVAIVQTLSNRLTAVEESIAGLTSQIEEINTWIASHSLPPPP